MNIEDLGIDIDSIRMELRDGSELVYLGTREELGLWKNRQDSWPETFDRELTTRCASALDAAHQHYHLELEFSGDQPESVVSLIATES